MSELPEGWKVVRLGDMVEVFDRYRIPLDEEFRRTIPGPYPYCGATGVIDHINDYIFDGEYLLVAEDGGKYGPFEETAYIMRGKFWANNHVHILKGKEGVVEDLFLMYYLNFIDVRKHILGTTREKLNQEALRNIPILKPPLPEQRKISEILSKIDSLIEKTEKIIEKYERIKRGLAQDLLTRGIDENGRVRSERTHEFKDSPLGRIPKEWKIVKLGDVSFLKARIGWQGLRADEYLEKGDYYLVTGINFKDGRIDWDSCVYVSKRRYEMDKNIQLKVGDVLVTKDGTIGKVAYVDYLPKPATLGTGVFVLRPINNSYEPRYLYYVLTSFIFERFMESLKAGSTITHLYQKDFVLFEFPLPPLPEQRRIAQVLAKVDTVLEKERAELEKLRRLKRGLMNDLLTGKIRVTPLLEVSE